MAAEGNFAFIVPSGNFGNITAGFYAKSWGLPVNHYVVAINANDVVSSPELRKKEPGSRDKVQKQVLFPAGHIRGVTFQRIPESPTKRTVTRRDTADKSEKRKRKTRFLRSLP